MEQSKCFLYFINCAIYLYFCFLQNGMYLYDDKQTIFKRLTLKVYKSILTILLFILQRHYEFYVFRHTCHNLRNT